MSIVRSPKLFSARERDIEPVVKQLLADSLLGQEPGLATKPLALAFDLDAFEAQFTAAGGLPEFLQLSMKKYAAAAKIAGRSQSCTDPAKTVEDSQSCTDPFLHCIACKSNPLVTLLSLALKNGAGCECASINEVRLALEVGFPAGNVVLDSPVKTVAEIEACLLLGVHLNIDNIQELGRIQKMRATHPRLCKSNSVIGLRINPLVGAGTIKALSVSTRRSKFGVPVLPSGEAKSTSDDDGVLTEDEFVQLFLQFPFLSCVHVHVGSQGCGLRLLSKGVARAVDMCQKINAAAKRRQVRTIDIGGGLPVNFKDEATTPTFAEYAAALDAACPILFAQPPIFDRIITEFGRALNAKTAWMVSRVEYTKKAGACTIALTHAGSDLFTRNCYAPQNYSNRVAILGSDGVMRGPEIYPRSGDGAAAPTSKLYEHDIAGKCLWYFLIFIPSY